MIENLLTQRQLCKILSISRGTLNQLRRNGLPSIRLGKLVRYKQESVMDWLEAMNVTQTQKEHKK